MSEIADRYRRRADAFEQTAANVAPDCWSNQSPCDDWKARDVVGHIVDMHGVMLRPLGRGLTEAASITDDPLDAYRSARADIEAVLDDPDLAGVQCETPMGPMTIEQHIDGVVSSDLIIHRWDLAERPVRTTRSIRTRSSGCCRLRRTSATRCARQARSAPGSSCSVPRSRFPPMPHRSTGCSDSSAATPADPASAGRQRQTTVNSYTIPRMKCGSPVPSISSLCVPSGTKQSIAYRPAVRSATVYSSSPGTAPVWATIVVFVTTSSSGIASSCRAFRSRRR